MPEVFAVASFYGGGLTQSQERSGRPLCPVLVHLPCDGVWMTQASMDEFAAVQRDHFPAHGTVSPDQKGPMVQIERYAAGYGFDHAGSRHHDPMASQSARRITNTFFDLHLQGPG
jgi:carboxymethylenebutenolidase